MMKQKQWQAWLLFMLIVTTVFTGCSNAPALPQDGSTAPNAAAEQVKQPGQSQGNPQGTMQVTVYFAAKDALHLIPELVTVPKNDHPAHTAMELLIQGTQKAQLVSVVPQGTKLRGIQVKDHIAYVDFNDKLIKNLSGGSATETLVVAAIVNTLTEFPEIEKVQILIDGKKVDTLTGHMDTAEPLSRSEKIIKK